ncbi:unnamed protein product, partial [Urochloa humidicola]
RSLFLFSFSPSLSIFSHYGRFGAGAPDVTLAVGEFGSAPAHSLPGRGSAPRLLLAAGEGNPGELRPRQSKEIPDELPLGGSARWRARASSHHGVMEEAPTELRSRWICAAPSPTSSAHDRSARRRAASSSCNNGARMTPMSAVRSGFHAAASMYGLILLSPSPSLRRPSHPRAAGRAARPSSKSGGAVGWLVWRDLTAARTFPSSPISSTLPQDPQLSPLHIGRMSRAGL